MKLQFVYRILDWNRKKKFIENETFCDKTNGIANEQKRNFDLQHMYLNI